MVLQAQLGTSRWNLGRADKVPVLALLPEDVLPGVSVAPQRAHRWSFQVPVTFRSGESPIEGLTVNVSLSGLLVTFSQQLEVWTEGALDLLAGGYYLTVHARVARVEGREAGMSFLIEDENDRRAVDILIASASGQLVPEA